MPCYNITCVHHAGLQWTDGYIGQLRTDTPDGYILGLSGRPFKIAKFERRCHEFDSDFVPLALETYGGTSEKFDKLLEKLSSKAAEFNNIPYPILLNK